MSGVTVPDDTAGKEATCPNCGKSFPTPTRYSAAVVPDASTPVAGSIDPVRTSPHPAPPTPPASAPIPPPVPPGYVAPPLPPVAPSGFLSPSNPAIELTPSSGGYTRSIGFAISPEVIAWMPAVLLTLILVLSFFPWVGCFAGDSAVYSQRPWGAMFNLIPVTNFGLEKAGVIPGGWLDKMRGDWKLLVPYFLLLFVALALAWAERGMHLSDPRKIPPSLEKLWPFRNAIAAACVSVMLVLLVLQIWGGFSMERAIREQLTERFEPLRQKAADKPFEKKKLDYEEELAFRAYGLEHTTWLYLALFCNALAVAALLIRIALDGRENKPPPKILLHY
jgi:hypothetical protein